MAGRSRPTNPPETPLPPSEPTQRAGISSPVPIARRATGKPLPMLTNAQIEEILDAEDAAAALRLYPDETHQEPTGQDA